MQTPTEKQKSRVDTKHEFMYSIHLISAVQAGRGRCVVEIKPLWGLLQVCRLSDAAVKVRCETQWQQSEGAVHSLYRQEL